MQPKNGTIAGVAVLLFGAIVFGVGLHHLVATGTCSSTGYSSNYGPVPYCPSGTGWWFAFVFGGIFMVIIGGLVSGASSVALIIPTVFTAVGLGSLTVAFDSGVSSGTKTFSLIFGGAFAVVGLIPAFFLLAAGARKLGGGSSAPSRRPSASSSRHATLGAASTSPAQSAFGPPPTSSPFGDTKSEPDAIMGAYLASAQTASPPVTPSGASSTSLASQKRNDVFDRIAKLADLHKSGALTDDEFNREKAKLLAEL